MAESTLRAYLKEIDELIEHNQLDEAIAHCRHILETYPKHLDTYRLLGKAYLEAKRYGDAADIFQRVLSAVPDDFVSHVGMSIVREDEGNTDAAIWHMERAFETNPANPAIQQELRRLIGRRDGIEPHKVRLTRGALARMYAHGELFPQAVAELRAALQEDPERTDLLVVLAEMYWRTGQRNEAVEVCNRIIEKLPYCREANRILAAAYQASGRHDQAAPFHRRLASLDPYFAFVESAMADPQMVDPGSVRIERLIWEPGQVAAGQPIWASSLGVDLATKPEVAYTAPTVPLAGPMPSWLEELGAGEAGAGDSFERPSAAPPAPSAPVAPSRPADEIPDWMREAGWQPATGEAREGPVSFSDEDLAALEQGLLPGEDQAAGELAPGEIPEWLKAVAPKEFTQAAFSAGAPSLEPEPPIGEDSGPLPAWLQDVSADDGVGPPDDTGNVLGGWAPTPLEPEIAEAAEQLEPEVPGPAFSEVPPFQEARGIPTWIEESSPGATDTIVAWLGDRPGRDMGPEPENLPEWMREPLEEPPSALPEETPSQPSMPAWLSGVAEAAAQQEPVLPEEVPWLAEAETAETAEAPEAEEWVAGLGDQAGEPVTTGPREPPDWLRGIVEPGLARPGEPSAPKEPPEWLREAIEPVTGRRAAVEEPEPDWLRGLAEPELTAPARPATGLSPTWLEALKEEMGKPPKSMPEEVDWLRGIVEPEAAPQAEPEEELRAHEWIQSISHPEPLAREEAAETPVWLEGLGAEPSEAPIRDLAREAEMLGEREVPGAGQPAAEEDVLQWLESLAASQAAPEAEAAIEAYATAPETPLVEERALPEEPAESLEWLERLAAERGIETPIEEVAPMPEGPPQPSEAVPREPPEEMLPSWMEGLPGIEPEQPLPSDLSAEPVEAGAKPVEPEAPVWMKAPIVEPPTTPLEVPDWLLAAAREEVPAREAQALQEAAAEQAPVQPAGVPESLEVTGAEEEGRETPPTPLPEERIPTGMLEIPEWLKAAAAEEAPASEEPTPTEAPAATPVEERIPTGMLEIPEWLKAAATEEAPTAEEATPQEAPVALPIEERIPTGMLEIPDWLKGATAEEAIADAGPATEERIPGGIMEVPEWLKAAAEAETPPVAAGVPESLQLSGPEMRPGDKPSDEPTVEPGAREVPDWSATPVRAQPSPPEFQPSMPRAAEAELSKAMPEWRPPREPAAPAAPPPAPSPTAAGSPHRAAAIPMAAIAPPPSARAAIPMAAVAPVPAIFRHAAPAAPAPPASLEPGGEPPPARSTVGAAPEALERARRALASGDILRAAKDYGSLIRKKRDIPAVIEDLRAALARDASLAAFWQILGDAYMKLDMLPEAIDAYRRGLEAV